MSRIAIPDITSATGATADIYARVKKISGGGVPNTYAALGYLVPASLAAVLDAQGTLNSGSLSRQEHQRERINRDDCGFDRRISRPPAQMVSDAALDDGNCADGPGRSDGDGSAPVADLRARAAGFR
jgi:hypothetical protein